MNTPIITFKAESRTYQDMTFYEIIRYINGRKDSGEVADTMEEAEQKAAKANEAALNAVNPVAGSKGTILHYTDRNPCTVTKTSADGKTVWVKVNKTEIIKAPVIQPGGFAGHCTEPAEYKILDELEGSESCFIFRKNGKFIEKGSSIKDGLSVTFAYHLKFYDYNF